MAGVPESVGAGVYNVPKEEPLKDEEKLQIVSICTTPIFNTGLVLTF
jgi:hypothetical protein